MYVNKKDAFASVHGIWEVYVYSQFNDLRLYTFKELHFLVCLHTCHPLKACASPRVGSNQVLGSFCFGGSLVDEIFICAIDQKVAGPKLSVELPACSSSNKIARAEYIS